MSEIELQSILNDQQLDALGRIQKALARIGELHNDINQLMHKTRLGEVLAVRVPRSYPGVRLYDAGRLYGDLQNLLSQHEIRAEFIAQRDALKVVNHG